MYINLRIRSIRITCTQSPSFIHQYIRDMILSCEINKVFIGIHIKTGYKIYIRTIRSSSIPPFPTYLSWFYPTIIFQFTRRRQVINHFITQNIFIIGRNHKETPRKSSLSFCLSDVISFFKNLYATISVISKLQRAFRKNSSQSILICPLHKHTRIII